LTGTPAQRLPLRHALALGLLHGPTELLPISSSAHTTLLPWLAGWPYDGLPPELRKSFEVALHAGTAAALLCSPPWPRAGRRSSPAELPCSPAELPSPSTGLPSPPGGPRQPPVGSNRGGGRTHLGLLAAATIPPSAVGYAFGPLIERRLGTPTTIAAGLLAGSGGMLAGEVLARARGTAHGDGDGRLAGGRRAADCTPRDGWALGGAQALALLPGVSRSGAAFAAARSRGFSRADSDRLAWTVGLPVIAGAATLKAAHLAREGIPSALAPALAAGAASAFLSTLAGVRVLDARRRASLFGACVLYRVGLALFTVRRTRDNTTRTTQSSKK
jgi:undecaprenyl-diphosphatase